MYTTMSIQLCFYFQSIPMEVFFIINSLSGLVLLTALKLPGPCPSVPPMTHDINIKDALSNAEILHIVPFTVHNSTLFYGTNASVLPGITLQIARPHRNRGPVKDFPFRNQIDYVIVVCELNEARTQQNQSAFLQTNVEQLHDDRGRKSVNLSVLIIWSCVDDLETGNHDEAVLTSYDQMDLLLNLPPAEYNDRMQTLKTFAESYISQDMLQAIDCTQPNIYPEGFRSFDEFQVPICRLIISRDKLTKQFQKSNFESNVSVRNNLDPENKERTIF